MANREDENTIRVVESGEHAMKALQLTKQTRALLVLSCASCTFLCHPSRRLDDCVWTVQLKALQISIPAGLFHTGPYCQPIFLYPANQEVIIACEVTDSGVVLIAGTVLSQLNANYITV